MDSPNRSADVPLFPIQDDPRMTPGGTRGDWFGPVMIGLAILAVIAVGFGMIVAVFPGLVSEEEASPEEIAEVQEGLEESYSDSGWYESIEDISIKGDTVVVTTSMDDSEEDTLDSMCNAVKGMSMRVVEEPEVEVVSTSEDELTSCK